MDAMDDGNKNLFSYNVKGIQNYQKQNSLMV